MEHPLIGNIDHLNEEQLSEKITELYKKLAIAQRTGNGYLSNQVRMALETYQNKYQQLLRKSSNKDFENKIDIQ